MDDLEEEPLSLEQQEASLREYTQQYEEVINDSHMVFSSLLPDRGRPDLIA